MRDEQNALRVPVGRRGNGETILVIEDEPGVREMVRMLLEFRGFRTMVAENGVDGVELYQRHHQVVSAVVTDLRMPAMHGTEVIQQLRRINSDARIVAMSGVVDANSGFAEEPGKLAYLPKPMTSSELLEAMQSVLAVSGVALPHAS